jgi:hypothetical protein
MVQDILWKAYSHSDCQKKSCFLYGTGRFITVFTEACHWSLSWATRILFTPSTPVSLRSILMLSSHLRLVLPSGPFGPSNQNPINTSHLPHARHRSRSPHPPWFNHPNNIRLWSSSLCNFLRDPSSSLLGRNIFLNTVLRNPQSMFLPQSERPSFTPIQHNWVLCILIFRSFDFRREDKRFWTE